MDVRRRSLLGLGPALVVTDHKPRSACDAAGIPHATTDADITLDQTGVETLTQTSVQTSDYTASAGQIVPVDTSGGPVTITLPNAPDGGTLLAVKQINGTAGVTVASAGSDVFNIANGGTTLALLLLDQGVLLEYDSGIWIVLDDDLALEQLQTMFLEISNSLSEIALAGSTAQAMAQNNLGLGSAALLAHVQYMDKLGADATGGTDCTTIFNQALSNLPTITVSGVSYPQGAIEFGAGSYKLGTGLDTATVGPYVWVKGQGQFATILYYYGSGRCLRLQNPADSASVSNTIMAGGCTDLAIDGSNAGAGAIGLMYGDMNGGRIDVSIQHFNLTGSIGLQVINEVYDTEKTRGYARLIDNTVGAQFTVTDGPSVTGVTLASTTGSTATFTVNSGGFPGFYAGMLLYGSAGLTTPSSNFTSTMQVSSISGSTLVCGYTGTTPSGTSGTLTICSSTQSFDYNDWDFSILTTGGILSGGTGAGQEGVQFLNGANPAGGRLIIRGNFAQSNTRPWTGTAPAILHLDGAMPANHPTQGATYFSMQDVIIQAEGDPAGVTYRYFPIRFSTAAAASTAHGFAGCTGLMYFSGTSDASIGSAPVSFSGPIQGVPSLNRTNLKTGNVGPGTGAQSYFDSGRPVDSAGRPYQQITGLLGANPFTLVGAVSAAAPSSGTFAVNDVAFDLTKGGYWACTAAGTPGTWTYFGPGGGGGATLSTSFGTLASDVVFSGETTILTIGNLATGTWQIDASIVINQATASQFSVFETRVNGGTATYTTQGPTSSEGFTASSGAANQTTALRLSFLAFVTVAGTILITAKKSAGGGTSSAKAATTISSYAGATGYTAIKIG